MHVVVSATDVSGVAGACGRETRCVLNPTASPATFADLPIGCAYLGSGTGGADVSADGIYTVYAASRDNAGNTEVPISRTFRLTLAVVDGSPPTSVISLTSAASVGQNGWFVSPVHVLVSATDGMALNASGVAETRCVLDPATPPATFADLSIGCAYLGGGAGAGADVSADGVYAVCAASRDIAGNQEIPITKQMKLDQTAPIVRVAGVQQGAVYAFGEVPTALCVTSDATSGVALSATLRLSSNELSQQMGVFVATCSGATDRAGQVSAPVSVTYTVAPFVVFYLPQLIN